MNDAALKQKALLAMVVAVAFYALAVGLWFMKFEKDWRKAAKQYKAACTKFEDEEKLISEKAEWNERYETAKSQMPTFEIGKATDTTWLSKVEKLAKENKVEINGLKPGKEIDADDVQELPIEIVNIEASLEALVKFIHALENSGEGMFDVKQLNVKPSNKSGYLKGSMSLTCAYMRSAE